MLTRPMQFYFVDALMEIATKQSCGNYIWRRWADMQIASQNVRTLVLIQWRPSRRFLPASASPLYLHGRAALQATVRLAARRDSSHDHHVEVAVVGVTGVPPLRWTRGIEGASVSGDQPPPLLFAWPWRWRCRRWARQGASGTIGVRDRGGAGDRPGSME